MTATVNWFRSKWNSIFEFNESSRSEFIAAVAAATPKGSRVLDAGAGSCRYRPLFPHCEYRTQDFSQYVGNDHRYGDIDFVCDITQIPVPDGSFDLVLCTEVFEHIPRPDVALRELARLLKPGGLLVITAPLGSAIHMPPYHFYGGFSPYWYRYFFAPAGLEEMSIRPNGGFFKQYGQESQRFLSMLTPKNSAGKIFFFPLKLVLALWFRLLLPLACHFLDRFDRSGEFTVGYFVTARKCAVAPIHLMENFERRASLSDLH